MTMTVVEALTAFTLAAGIVTMTPGLDTTLVLRTATVEGRRPAVAASAGIILGVLTWGVIAALGLGALLAASDVAYTALRWIGGGYLVWIGLRMILHPHDPPHITPSKPRKGSGWFRRGLLSNLLNPKVGAFYVTFLPQFLPPGVEIVSFSVLLAAIHAAETVVWFALLIAATRPLAAWLRHPAVTRALDRLTGGVLIAFGLRLVLVGRTPD